LAAGATVTLPSMLKEAGLSITSLFEVTVTLPETQKIGRERVIFCVTLRLGARQIPLIQVKPN